MFIGENTLPGVAYLMLLIYLHHKERNKIACKMHVYEYPFLAQVWNQERVCNRRHSACFVSPAEAKGMESKESGRKAIRWRTRESGDPGKGMRNDKKKEEGGKENRRSHTP